MKYIYRFLFFFFLPSTPREGKRYTIILAVDETTTGPRFSFFLSGILVPAIAGRRRAIIMDNLRAHFHSSTR